jgi:hypothetical protein
MLNDVLFRHIIRYNDYDSSARALNAIRRCAPQYCKKDQGLMKMNKFAALAVMALLAACGGGSDGMVPVTSNPSGSGTPTPAKPGTTPTQPGTAPTQPGTTPTQPGTTPTAPTRNNLQARFGDAILVQQNLAKLDPTPVSNMPTSGSSTFSGSAFLSVSQGGQAYEMIGDSKLAVNFGNSEMTGNVTNVEGRRSNGSTFAAPGKITYDNGRFERQNRNVFAVDYEGDLAVDNKKISVDGTAIGAFYGNRSNAAIKPSGFLAVDETPDNANTTPLTNMTATVDGKSANGTVFITGRN